MNSETDACRELLASYCTGNGLDIGFGGVRPIVPTAICLDRAPGHRGRRSVEDLHPTHLAWDAFAPLPFRHNTLDYVYSSHCLEDARDTAGVLMEWNRVLKVGGHLVLFLPDQPTYAAHCQAHGVAPNQDHIHADFTLEFVKARKPLNTVVVHEQWPFPGNPYSFALVLRKTDMIV